MYRYLYVIIQYVYKYICIYIMQIVVHFQLIEITIN